MICREYRVALSALCFLILANTAWTQTIPFKTYQIKVQGMVCGFCSQGLIKIFKQQKDVLEFKVDLDMQQATVKVKQSSFLGKPEIAALVADGGLKAVNVEELK